MKIIASGMSARLPLKILNRSRECLAVTDKSIWEGREGKRREEIEEEGKKRTLERFHALHSCKNRFSV